MEATTRKAPEALEALFAKAKVNAVDIAEHLDVLRELASRCEHVTEFGVRQGNGSTVALLAGQPATLVSWDIVPYSIVRQEIADLIACRGRTEFQLRCGDTREVTIEGTDMLFIDTYHTARQLKTELERHGMKARRYIVMHDTDIYGDRGEDGAEPGLRAAIRWFQREYAFPLWQLAADRRNNNGLVVLSSSERSL